MKNKMSARQLCAAGFTGLLSLSAAVAGLDWRGALFAVPVPALAMWVASAAAERGGGLLKGVSGWLGKGLAILYIIWGMLAAGVALTLCGQRMSAAGVQGGSFWPMVLASAPVLWLAAGKPEAFARAAEIFYLAMLAVLAAVALLGARQVEWRWLAAEGAGIGRSFLTAAGTGCLGVYAVLLWNGRGDREKGRWLCWSGAGAAVLAVLSALTVGTLSPALAARTERPFFMMTVGLGQTARTEALLAMLWLAADTALLGLLVQSCRGLWRDVLELPGEKSVGIAMTAAAFLLALCVENLWDAEELAGSVLPIGGLVLGGGAPLLLLICGKRRGESRKEE